MKTRTRLPRSAGRWSVVLAATALLLGLGGAGAASANDGSGERAVGGTVTLMDTNPTIRLVSEDIFCHIPSVRVTIVRKLTG